MKTRKFADAGEIVEYVDSPSRKAALARALAEANNPEAIGEANPKYNMDEFTAYRQEKPARDPFAEIPVEPKAKPKVVTKEQLQAFKAKYGADKELTDYMNAQKGLTRRKPNSTIGEGTDAVAQARADTVDYGEVLKLRETGRTRGGPSYDSAGKPSNAGPDVVRSQPKQAKRMPGPFSEMAKGGSVSSRADGIAQRGKTRGKMC